MVEPEEVIRTNVQEEAAGLDRDGVAAQRREAQRIEPSGLDHTSPQLGPTTGRDPGSPQRSDSHGARPAPILDSEPDVDR